MLVACEREREREREERERGREREASGVHTPLEKKICQFILSVYLYIYVRTYSLYV